MVFSVTDRNSFNNVQKWINDLVQHASDFVLFLVGNKSDLKTERVVSYEEGE